MPITNSTERAYPAKTATRYWADCDLSIHPRNWPPKVLDALKWNERRKLNTSKPASPARARRSIAGLEKHLLSHSYDAASKRRLADLRST